MYRGSATMQQAESMQRDALISALKKELYDLQDREHQFLSLNDQINNLQAKHSMLRDEKERIQNQNRIKTDINRKNIAQLRAEIDGLKIQIHKCSVQIQDILREATAIKRVCQNRQTEIAQLMGANQQLDAKNQQLVEENKGKVNRQIKALKDQRNRCDADNQRLHRTLQENVAALKVLEKQARLLQSSNSKLTNILGLAEKDYISLIEDMKNCDQMVNNNSKKLDQLNKQIQDLKDKTLKLEKDCAKNQQELKNISEHLQLSINKNKQQTKQIKQLQNTLRTVQNQLDRAVLQRDALQNDHAAFDSENKLLNTEIDSILRQIIQYESINRQLQKEVEHYILCDQQARNMLNRKDAMKNMLDTVSARLNQTGQNIAHLR